MSDQQYIQLALELAAQGAGLVSPNPLVGSLVVKDGEILGRGYHRYDDLKHAEVWALEEAGQLARGSTVYVNLEPCSHQGSGKRTPPCVEALIEAGVHRVVASMVDPNPRVNGRGFELLRGAGIEVEVGLNEAAAQRLNEKYTKFVTTGLPFILLKSASSLDGKIATRQGTPHRITGEAALAASQKLRHEYDAILIGIGTAVADDPELSDRTGLPRRKPLARIVLDGALRLPTTSRLASTAREWPLIVFTSVEQSERRSELESLGAEVVKVDAVGNLLDLPQVLAELGWRQISSLIVEGGGEVAGSFVQAGLIDKATFFIAPKIIGGHDSVSAVGGSRFNWMDEVFELKDVVVHRLGADWEFTGYPASKPN